MKRKGFTLVELLAVIIILGLLALLIVPKVNSIVKESKVKSYEVSINNLVKSLNSIAIDKKANLIPFDGCSIDFDNDNNTCTDSDYSGELPDSGSISVDGDGVVNGSVGFGNDRFFVDKNNVQIELLPAEYVRVNYIESTGTQYIDTGVKPNGNTKIDIDFAFKSGKLGYWIPLFGVREFQYKSYAIFFYSQSSKSSKVASNYGDFDSGTISNVYTTRDERHNLKSNGGQLYLDGILQSSISTSGSMSGFNKNLLLFAFDNIDVVETRGSREKIYFVKIYDGETLIRDMIPCVRKSDNTAGLYDLVNDKFYVSLGTENFKYKILNQNEKMYTKIEYIESTGTQFIDTGVKPNSKTRIDIDFAYLGTTSSETWIPLFGSRETDNSIRYAFFINESNLKISPNYGLFDPGSNPNAYINAYIIRDNRHNLKNIGGQFYLDDVLQSSISTSGSMDQMTQNICLFATTDHGAVNIRGSKERIYSVKIYDGDTLIRNMIPCIRNIDDEIGFYDEVNDKFYFNLGTDQFVSGEKVY